MPASAKTWGFAVGTLWVDLASSIISFNNARDQS